MKARADLVSDVELCYIAYVLKQRVLILNTTFIEGKTHSSGPELFGLKIRTQASHIGDAGLYWEPGHHKCVTSAYNEIFWSQ